MGPRRHPRKRNPRPSVCLILYRVAEEGWNGEWRLLLSPRALARASTREACHATAIICWMFFLTAHLGADDVPKEMPGFALKLLQPELLDRSKVGCACLDRYARQQAVQLQALNTGSVLHDILTRQIITALLQHIRHGLSYRVAIDHERVVTVCFGIVFVEKGVEVL